MIERVGNYRITDEIGSGGMAVVYKGIQESLQRTVAIKALKTSVSNDNDVIARFEREATSIASFQQENIITVYDFFRERGALFIVMEYVEGIDLYDLLDRCDHLPCDVAAIICLQVTRALEYAHFRGVIHRDVKPANIILSKVGTVKLTDFGIARVEESDLTEYGVGLGTPAYMSPEQALGEHLDHRSDIFSLGIVMYQAVTGQKPFLEDTTKTVMEKIRTEPPAPPRSLNPEIPRALEKIILNCMEKAPQDRYGSTQELIVHLEQYLAVTVKQNYRVRLLMYLQTEGLISADETQATLDPAMIGESLGRVPLLRIKRRSRWLISILALIILSCPLLGFFAYRLLTPDAKNQSLKVRHCIPIRKQGSGYLKVSAHPWARVEINGKIISTTPFDKPLDLTPGTYRIRLLNPYFETVEREVTIDLNKVHTLTAVLKQRDKNASGATSTSDAVP